MTNPLGKGLKDLTRTGDRKAVERVAIERRPSRYQSAVEWIAYNDDTDFIDIERGGQSEFPSVTACLVADVFGRTTDQVCRDVYRVLLRIRSERAVADDMPGSASWCERYGDNRD